MFSETQLRTYVHCSKLYYYEGEYIKKDFLFLLVEKSLTYFLTQYAVCQQTNKTIDINTLIKQSISFSIDLVPPDKQINSNILFYKNYISHWFASFIKENPLQDKNFFSGFYSTKYNYKNIFVKLNFLGFALNNKTKTLYAFVFNYSLDKYLSSYDIVNILKYDFLKTNFPKYKKIVLISYSCSSNIISSNTNYPNRNNYKSFESTKLDTKKHLCILNSVANKWKEKDMSFIPSCNYKSCPKRKVCLNDAW